MHYAFDGLGGFVGVGVGLWLAYHTYKCPPPVLRTPAAVRPCTIPSDYIETRAAIAGFLGVAAFEALRRLFLRYRRQQ